MSQGIGIMEGAYFVGRKEVLDWVNSTCALNLTKIEDTANGCAACMLLDQIFPGQVPLKKVNWNAKQSFEFLGNYKILQDSFIRLKVDRHIDVDRLITGRYMDNLEFMQWFKRYYEITTGGKDYGKSKAAGARSGSAPPGRQMARSRSAAASSENSPGRANAASSRTQKKNGMAAPTSPVQTLKESNEALNRDMIGLEKERDFYFGKLRDIEILLQDMEEDGSLGQPDIGVVVSSKIFKILYATADGFVQSPSAQSQVSSNSKMRGDTSGASPAGVVAAPAAADNYGDDDDDDIDDDDDDDDDDDNEPISPVKLAAAMEAARAYTADDDSVGKAVPGPPAEEDEDEDED
eukprot:GSChrysophyteH1.ASY1.ANO1.3067.1 assembled CDS